MLLNVMHQQNASCLYKAKKKIHLVVLDRPLVIFGPLVFFLFFLNSIYIFFIHFFFFFFFFWGGGAILNAKHTILCICKDQNACIELYNDLYSFH